MATAVFITGLAGSGKTTLATKMQGEHPYEYCDEGFWAPDKRQENCAWLINHLREGHDCIVAEGAFMFKSVQDYIESVVKRCVPDAEVKWKCFENDQEKAAINIRRRPRRDPEGHICQNRINSCRYTYPPGADILPIVTGPP